MREARFQALADGRWARRASVAGRWDQLHPRWPLEVLRRACTSASRPEPDRIVVQLDRARVADVSEAGVAPRWQLEASITPGPGERVAQVAVDFLAEDGAMYVRFAFGDLDRQPGIRPPDATSVVEERAYLDELLRG